MDTLASVGPSRRAGVAISTATRGRDGTVRDQQISSKLQPRKLPEEQPPLELRFPASVWLLDKNCEKLRDALNKCLKIAPDPPKDVPRLSAPQLKEYMRSLSIVQNAVMAVHHRFWKVCNVQPAQLANAVPVGDMRYLMAHRPINEVIDRRLQIVDAMLNRPDIHKDDLRRISSALNCPTLTNEFPVAVSLIRRHWSNSTNFEGLLSVLGSLHFKRQVALASSQLADTNLLRQPPPRMKTLDFFLARTHDIAVMIIGRLSWTDLNNLTEANSVCSIAATRFLNDEWAMGRFLTALHPNGYDFLTKNIYLCPQHIPPSVLMPGFIFALVRAAGIGHYGLDANVGVIKLHSFNVEFPEPAVSERSANSNVGTAIVTRNDLEHNSIIANNGNNVEDNFIGAALKMTEMAEIKIEKWDTKERERGAELLATAFMLLSRRMATAKDRAETDPEGAATETARLEGSFTKLRPLRDKLMPEFKAHERAVLSYAVDTGDVAMVKSLTVGATAGQLASLLLSAATAKNRAVEESNMEIVKYVNSSGQMNQDVLSMALGYAAEYKNEKIAEYLVELGGDPMKRDAFAVRFAIKNNLNSLLQTFLRLPTVDVKHDNCRFLTEALDMLTASPLALRQLLETNLFSSADQWAAIRAGALDGNKFPFFITSDASMVELINRGDITATNGLINGVDVSCEILVASLQHQRDGIVNWLLRKPPVPPRPLTVEDRGRYGLGVSSTEELKRILDKRSRFESWFYDAVYGAVFYYQ